MTEKIENILEAIDNLSTTLRSNELCYYDESGTGITTDDLKALARFCRELAEKEYCSQCGEVLGPHNHVD